MSTGAPLQIAILLSSLGLMRGGLETIAAGLARALAHRGHDVVCVAGYWPGRRLSQDLSTMPVRWLRIPCLPGDLWGAQSRRWRARRLKLQSLSFSAACRLRPAVRHVLDTADVSLSILEVETTYLSRWRTQSGQAHVSYFPGIIDRDWLQKDRSTVRVAISEPIASTCDEASVSVDGVVPPGLKVNWEASDVSIRSKVTRLLFVGRLEANKGVRELLEIFIALAPRFPELTLYLLGNGPLRQELAAAARRAGAGDRVTFAGSVPPQSVRAHLQTADLFLFPSRYESFGIAVAEAQLAGVPVVCSDLPVMRYVTGDTAVRLPVGDRERWVEEIARLIGDIERRRNLSRRGRENARRFTWDRVAPQMESFLQMAIDRAQQRTCDHVEVGERWEAR